MDTKLKAMNALVDGKKYELPPDILGNKDKYEFLQWDCELGDAVIFDMRTLHGTLSSSIPKKTLSRYTLRVAKEDAKISYVGDWTSYNYQPSNERWRLQRTVIQFRWQNVSNLYMKAMITSRS